MVRDGRLRRRRELKYSPYNANAVVRWYLIMPRVAREAIMRESIARRPVAYGVSSRDRKIRL